MTFEEILDQAIAMLQRRGRLTYGTLKRQFQLDNAALEDLKNELIEGQRLAVDERGNVLVWTGGADVPQLRPSPPTADVQLTQGHPLPTAPPPPDAERRQLTVMFCDLVDSTKLSSKLDPEEYREVVRAYQRVCSEVITRFDGHIAQLLGDGLLMYFGYPQAHEDDAQRAVRTGLGILDTLGNLNTRLKREKGIQLAIHMGIHTGLVVVGGMGEAGRQEQLALGEVPNLTARIEGLAAPNTIAVSEATYRLVQGYFECQALGAQTLRGVAEPVQVYRVLQDSGARGRLDVAVTRGLTPLVGRESEVTLLLERWAQARSGQGQVILLSGDAGIGKSRIVQRLKDHVANEPHTRWECRSSPYFEHTALFPVTDLFQRLWQCETGDTPDEKLGKLEQGLSQYRLPLEDTVPLFAPLLVLPVPENRYPVLHLSPQRQRQKTLETIVAILLQLAEHQPVLFILEDLHWTDPSTLELLNLVLDQTPTASVLVLLTCRPHFQPAWHHRSYLTEMTVNRLSREQMTRMAAYVAGGKHLPHQVLQQIVEKTDGVPLFVEELTKAILEAGYLKEVDGHYELTGAFPALAIPATLQDSLMARLDRLMTAKGIAQLGAVIGPQFSYDLLQAVSQLDTRTLQRELGRLVEAELLYQRGVPPQATYTFKHALIQDAAYQSLLNSTRQQYHQRIVQILEELFPETVAAQPELLGHHCTEAGLIAQAVGYWQRAGHQASDRSAYLEAVSHFTTGIELLKTLPETSAHTQQAVTVHIALGAALLTTKGQGAPEVEHAYSQARALCQQVGETPQLFQALWGLWYFYLVRAEFQTAHELGEQLLNLAQRVQAQALLLLAHRVLGQTLSFLGQFSTAQVHLDRGMTLYDPEQHRSLASLYGQDQGVICRSWAALALWCLGYPDQALRRSREALTLAQELAHPFSLAYAMCFAGIFCQLRREVQAAQERATAEIALCTEQGFALYLARGTILRGWTMAAQRQGAEGLAQMRQGLASYQATGAVVFRPYYLAFLAEAYGKVGQAEKGLSVLAEALAAVHKAGERFYEAELNRLKGELLLVRSAENHGEAEAYFQKALGVARRQQAKSWELRAAMSLARLWQQQGKRTEARELLAPIYGWFTEGFDTADLQEAKALLEVLA
jgi:predicted ATPase/class 3 adenylate cyclase